MLVKNETLVFDNIDVISTGLESEYVNVCNFSSRLRFINIYYLSKLKADMVYSKICIIPPFIFDYCQVKP